VPLAQRHVSHVLLGRQLRRQTRHLHAQSVMRMRIMMILAVMSDMIMTSMMSMMMMIMMMMMMMMMMMTLLSLVTHRDAESTLKVESARIVQHVERHGDGVTEGVLLRVSPAHQAQRTVLALFAHRHTANGSGIHFVMGPWRRDCVIRLRAAPRQLCCLEWRSGAPVSSHNGCGARLASHLAGLLGGITLGLEGALRQHSGVSKAPDVATHEALKEGQCAAQRQEAAGWGRGETRVINSTTIALVIIIVVIIVIIIIIIITILLLIIIFLLLLNSPLPES
jgi:hypothetical protein